MFIVNEWKIYLYLNDYISQSDLNRQKVILADSTRC